MPTRILILDNNYIESCTLLDSFTLEDQIQTAMKVRRLIKRSMRTVTASSLIKMWRPYPQQLDDALGCLFRTYEHRNEGKRHPLQRCLHHITRYRHGRGCVFDNSCPWFNSTPLIESHRALLLRQDYVYYSRFDWDVDMETPEFWPSVKS